MEKIKLNQALGLPVIYDSLIYENICWTIAKHQSSYLPCILVCSRYILLGELNLWILLEKGMFKSFLREIWNQDLRELQNCAHDYLEIAQKLTVNWSKTQLMLMHMSGLYTSIHSKHIFFICWWDHTILNNY